MARVIDSKKEFIKFCKKNNIKCTKNKNGIIKDSLVLELPSDVVYVGEFSHTMGVIYHVEEVDEKVIIMAFEHPYGAGISYKTCYTFDNSDNQVLAVFGLRGGWNVLVKSKNDQGGNIESLLAGIFINE